MKPEKGAKRFYFVFSDFFLFCLWCDMVGRFLMLYRRGRPTPVVLLLLMVITKLTLPLSSHSPLGLHHLLRLVRAARGLVPLRCVEVLQVGRVLVRRTAADITKVGHGVGTGSGATAGSTGIWMIQMSVGRGSSALARPAPDYTHRSLGISWVQQSC